MGIGLLLLPLAWAWAESEAIAPAMRRAPFLLCLGAGISAALGLIAQQFVSLAPVDPLGVKKYALGLVYVSIVFASFFCSFLRIQGASAEVARRWVFRSTLVFLLLLSPWIKITLVYGDEPFYLMQAASIAEDGDADIADDFRDRAYAEFLDVRLADDVFLAGWSIDKDSPPGRSKYFVGSSLVMAPLVTLGRWLGLNPYLMRQLLGVPFLVLVALAISRLAMYLPVTGRAGSTAPWFTLLFLLCTPFHYWAQMLGPEPILFFLMAFSMTEIFPPGEERMAANQSRLRAHLWTIALLAIGPWFHPRALYVYPALLAILWFSRGRRIALVASAVGSGFVAAKMALDYTAKMGFFAGYERALSKSLKSVSGFPSAFCSHWIDADSGFVVFAPIMILVIAVLPVIWRRTGSWRMRALLLVYMSLSWGTRGTWDYVNGIGRHDFYWVAIAVCWALAALNVPRGILAILSIAGLGWNYVFTVLPLVFYYAPSAGLREITGIEMAYLMPQLGRRLPLQIPLPLWVPYTQITIWVAVVAIVCLIVIRCSRRTS